MGYSGARVMGFFWSLSVLAVIKAAFNFSKGAESKAAAEEGWHRLLTIHSKNKLGYHTRWMSDFDLFLESMLNERFLEESSDYYSDHFVSLEIQDLETGLQGDLSQADVRHMLKDKAADHHEPAKVTRKPDRVGTNYPKSDALSCYKLMPRGKMPEV